MFLEAPPINSTDFKRKKPQLSVLIPPKSNDQNDKSPKRNQKFRNSMKSPTALPIEIEELEDEKEQESPTSPTKRKMMPRASCIPTFPLSNLFPAESSDRPQRNLKNRVSAFPISQKEISADEYKSDRLIKFFEDQYLKKQKDHLRSSWKRTTQMAAFIGRMNTMKRGNFKINKKKPK